MKIVLVVFAALVCCGADSITPPADQKVLMQAHGVGDQIYTCKNGDGNYSWVLKAPDAKLLSSDGKPVGRHFAGPTWEWSDKSSIVGKMAASQPSPDPNSIPWLLVNVIHHAGDGVMSSVLTVRRINTQGGKASASGCDESHAGGTQKVHYEADYLFYAQDK